MAKTPTQLRKHYESWAKQNGLEILYTLDTESLPSVIYGFDEEHDHLAFEKLMLKTGAPFMVVAITDVTVELGMYQEDPEWFRQHDDEYQDHLLFLKTKSDELASLEVGFIYQGIYCYQYLEADWMDEYEQIQAICYSYDGDIGREDDDDETDNIDLGGLLN